MPLARRQLVRYGGIGLVVVVAAALAAWAALKLGGSPGPVDKAHHEGRRLP